MYPIVSRLKTLLFPHISRIFTAGAFQAPGVVVFWAGCTVFFLCNIWMQKISPQAYRSLRLDILSHPLSSETYIRFGEELFREGKEVMAVKQIGLTRDMTNTHVLGAEAETENILSRWDSETTASLRTYNYWKNVTEEKPDYRDAYIQLAIASDKLKKTDEAELYLDRAESLDPNNITLSFVKAHLGL